MPIDLLALLTFQTEDEVFFNRIHFGYGRVGTIDDNLKVQQSVIPAGVFGPTDLKVAFTKKFNSNVVARSIRLFSTSRC